MTSVVIEQFGGIAPKVDPRQLADNLAQTAENCKLDGRALEPMYNLGTSAGTVGSTADSIYYYADSTWLDYTDDRTFAEVPITDDTLGRIVFTEADNYPHVYSGQGPADYRLGVPAPSAAPTIHAYTASSGNPVTISYVYTYVTVWGEEGPPSAPSASQTIEADTDVELNFTAVPGGAYNFGSGAVARFYRSNGGNYQFVADFPVTEAGAGNETGGGDVTDNVDAADLGEVIPSTLWVGPADDDTSVYPNGPLQQIIALPNGVLAGWAHKTLMFSEPFVYYAWPVPYRITFEEKIVGIAAIQSGVLVVTEGRPYVVTGVNPAAMATITIDINQAGASRDSIVDMGDYAIYASEEGLVLVQGTQAQLITREFFDREDFQAYAPSSIRAYQWEGKYLAFYDTGSVTAGFIFDPRGGVNSFVEIDDYYPVGFFHGKTNTTYVKNSTAVQPFGRGSTAQTYTWRSKKFVLERPLSFAWFRLEAWNDLSTSNVTARIYADGSLIATLTMDDSVTPYKILPGGFRAKIWEIELEGTNPVTRCGLFESLEEAV